MIRWADRLARGVITAGGLLIIGTVIAVVLVLVGVVLPLFQGAKADLRAVCVLPDFAPKGTPAAVGIDLVEIGRTGEEDLLTGYVLSQGGEFLGFELLRPADGSQADPEAVLPRVIFRTTLLPSRSEVPREVAPSSGGEGLGVEREGLGDNNTLPSDILKKSSSSREAPPSALPVWIRHAQSIRPGQWTLLWSDGSVALVQIDTEVQRDELGWRRIAYRVEQIASWPPVAEAPQPIQALVQQEEKGSEGGSGLAVLLLADNRILVRRHTVETDLFGEPGERSITNHWITSGIPGRVTAMTLNREGTILWVGTETGYVVRFRIEQSGQPVQLDVAWVPGRVPVTALRVLFGDVSLAVGGADGSLSLWFPVRKEEPMVSGAWPDRLVPIRSLVSQQGEVRVIWPSERNKTLLSLGKEGIVHLDYGTTGRHLLRLAATKPLEQVAYSSRGNAVLGIDAEGRVYVWQISAPHADVSWSALFGRVWYEGHEKPKFLWQSSGTDEPKMSLVPVIFGTFKATFYAMLFALPLALGSAVYVSYFTQPGIRRVIKPVVEIMAAVPTVVIGFLVLLWAAPLIGRWIVAVLLSLLALPVTFVLWMFLWQVLRRWHWLRRVEEGHEFLAVILPLVLGMAAVAVVAGPVEQAWFGGNFRQWLYTQTHLRYDQLNALVVALGLGFAIIPIIFSISEDALSSIPHTLTAASLALGASRWQSLWRVVLPSASPGIFAAVMIGLGRAVGETMIVFMAAGNTPVLDPSPLNGFRTLSANIAVEISEHPRDGTLYRVLFLCAVILFAMTFVLNTAAELVRIRLRRKFGQY